MLEQDLQDIGLNEKEAKVYLATLELGQSVVQGIARKAGVNRATTYFIIEGLMKLGLISSFHQGKKQFFIAASPDKLIEMIERDKTLIQKKEENLRKLLPELKSLNNTNKNKPVVKYYEGKEGIKTMLEEFLAAKKGMVNMAYSVDAVNKIFGAEEKEQQKKKRINQGIKTKVIYTYSNGVLESDEFGSRRKVPLDKFPINCDIAVYENKIRLASLGERLVGIIIEDKELADSLKAILDLAWEAAEKYQK